MQNFMLIRRYWCWPGDSQSILRWLESGKSVIELVRQWVVNNQVFLGWQVDN